MLEGDYEYNSRSIKFRREPFGGLVYNSVKGYTVEINRTAELFIELLDAGLTIPAAFGALASHFQLDVPSIKHDFEPVVQRFAKFEIVVPAAHSTGPAITSGSARERADQVFSTDFPRQIVKNSLNIPEVLHLAITGSCPLHCPACYVDAGNPHAEEIKTPDVLRLVDIMEANKIFQLGLGGGEALVHPDLIEIVGHATKKGITVAITTSGVNLDLDMARKLKDAGIKQIQVSHDGFSPAVFEQTRSPGSFKIAKKAIANLKQAGVEFGFNVLLTPAVLRELPQLVRYAEEVGAVELILLRPKPSGRDDQKDWFSTNKLTAAHQAGLINFLSHLNTTLRIRTDTSFCMLYHFMDPGELYLSGVFGCTAARRFCSINADGSMFPCSHFFKYPEYNGGSCMQLIENWQTAPAFDSFRSIEDHLDEPCRSCQNMPVCKGCRKVALLESGCFNGVDPYCIKMERSRK
nr:radical SAM protein [Candidatus Sigynarchaeota archaeon]